MKEHILYEYALPTPDDMKVSKINQEIVDFIINEFSKEFLSQKKGQDGYYLNIKHKEEDFRKLNQNEIAYIKSVFESKGWDVSYLHQRSYNETENDFNTGNIYTETYVLKKVEESKKRNRFL